MRIGAATNSSNSELQAMSLADQPRAPISHTLTLKLLLKMFAGTNGQAEDDKPLVVCFGEMLIDFVPTAARVSLAETPAFAKAVNGALANVAVGVSRLRG
ncbi:probable fructokinase-7 isoform X3 [Chenopodium quinoa]|nr:probable fructokinase-7 isoform X3 [Chenopodium quinoa]